MTVRTYLDIHILQSVPPSNLNRDDAGSPKHATYGGVQRARVSSQAWKRATRRAFDTELGLPPAQLGVRTQRIAALLADRIAARTGLDAAACRRLGEAVPTGLGIKAKTSKTKGRKGDPEAGGPPAETAYLLFLGNAQLDAIADRVAGQAAGLADLADDALTKAMAELVDADLLRQGHPIDVALFGRMVADLTHLNVDAAVQVAHALTTHGVETEFDYFTAVDDGKSRDENAGAAMLGTVEFTSGTLYRYATVGLHQLAANLDGDREATAAAVAAFLRAFALSMPGGHGNTFAHRTLPWLVAVVARADQPVNLVSAFESPVHAGGDGLTGGSAARLARELDGCTAQWGLSPLAIHASYPADGAAAAVRAAFGDPQPFDAVVEAVTALARERLAGAAA
ncbi:type I-E CRISPR-associated protein Cas7/Cse4/CasC [Pilimelia anulata]|uniref:Type I-E CRISPR-associated protein Cas7/Cse4/CasC n=1 Tax=Pilimelia anulata TaxID=53371 RepID=A0A8J3F8D4_9ACTN|nr:type I-E CRISPR-associated protein Cas7/Cse4/CasC [Pilimelia anulata]GGJ92624.1 type I-E CRISPR-associated protein Cas7/Cse4/CasC [Pilimelia anulata]